MDPRISYGPTVSGEGIKHANNPWSNTKSSVKASSRSLSNNRGRSTISLSSLEVEQLQLETEAADLRRIGEPRRMGDGSIVWTAPKKPSRVRVEECDRWAAKETPKAIKIPKRTSCGAKGHGNGDTNDKSVRVGKNPYDLGLRVPTLATNPNVVVVPDSVDQAERDKFRDVMARAGVKKYQ